MTDHRSTDDRSARVMSNPEPPDRPDPADAEGLGGDWPWRVEVRLPEAYVAGPIASQRAYWAAHHHDVFCGRVPGCPACNGGTP